jgi:GTP-binding protein
MWDFFKRILHQVNHGRSFTNTVFKHCRQCPTFARMIIRSAEFQVSNTRIDKLPLPVLPEYAFIGRSNVGKSSLINMLTRKKGLAKTSQIPGKTQLINHFLINENWQLVDLPGYGYARTSKSKRADWQKFISYYLRNRENLQCVFVLIDSRLDPQKIDIEFCCWLGENGLPFQLVFTKADKQSRVKTDQTIAKFRKALLGFFEEVPRHYITSSETGEGREEILNFIDELNQEFSI